MQEFDIKKALNGHPLCFSNGEKIEFQFKIFNAEDGSEYPFVFKSRNCLVFTFNLCGKSEDGFNLELQDEPLPGTKLEGKWLEYFKKENRLVKYFSYDTTGNFIGRLTRICDMGGPGHYRVLENKPDYKEIDKEALPDCFVVYDTNYKIHNYYFKNIIEQEHHIREFSKRDFKYTVDGKNFKSFRVPMGK